MQIKIHRKPTGIPQAQIAHAPGVTDLGAAQVTSFVSALDSFDIPTVVASVRYTPAEARAEAARMIAAADEAERQATKAPA